MKRFLLTTLFVLMLSLVPVYVVLAQGTTLPTDFNGFLATVSALFMGLVGWPLLLSSGIALGMKLFPAAAPDTWKWISFGLNALVYIALGIAVVTGATPWISNVDNAFGIANNILVQILTLLGLFGGALGTTAHFTRGIASSGGKFHEAHMALHGK